MGRAARHRPRPADVARIRSSSSSSPEPRTASVRARNSWLGSRSAPSIATRRSPSSRTTRSSRPATTGASRSRMISRRSPIPCSSRTAMTIGCCRRRTPSTWPSVCRTTSSSSTPTPGTAASSSITSEFARRTGSRVPRELVQLGRTGRWACATGVCGARDCALHVL